MPTKQDLVAECATPEGRTNADIARRFGISSSEAGSALSNGVARGWLYKAHGMNGLTRYFSTLTDANAFLRNKISGRINTTPDAPFSAAAPQHTGNAKVFMATPRGDGPRLKKCPPDRNVVTRPGANDFRQIPSLSPFHKGAVR
jgi:hypothetical protein